MIVPDHLTYILRNCMWVKKQHLELEMEQWTGSKLGKEYNNAVYCHPADLTSMQSISCEMLGFMKHKLESRFSSVHFSSVQSLSHVQLFATPGTVAHQASLSITNSWSLLKLMSIELVMSSNHLTLCHPLFHLPSIFPSIRVFSNESVLLIRWPKY